MNGCQRASTPGPLNGTLPKPVAAVCSSESCRRGLRRATSCAGVSKLAGSAVTMLGAERSGPNCELQRYHQAMSWGLTNDTVAHHGRFAGAFAYQAANCPAICGSMRQPCPGPPSGDG